MTILTILFLSLLSTLTILKLIALTLNTTVRNLIICSNEAYTLYQLLMSFILTTVFFIVYCAINNTFLHFKY